MVKFGKNKFKILNKLTKKQNASISTSSNKVIKKKINAEKKVSFQKEVLLKEAFKSDGLLKNIKTTKILQVKSRKSERIKVKQEEQAQKVEKLKPVEKRKRRQKTQISDTKLLLSLMKKK